VHAHAQSGESVESLEDKKGRLGFAEKEGVKPGKKVTGDG